VLNYDEVYRNEGDWRLLPCFDHPSEPARCHVAGTGLTHKASAENRDKMHEKDKAKSDSATPAKAPLTDSMKMFQWGLENGKPSAGDIGVQPEWFYKGTGLILRGCGQAMDIPAFADDGGEEPEIVGVYLIDDEGQPRRVGMCIGNEFADHIMEKKNYLYLAPSKLRDAAVGPELVIDPTFDRVKGQVTIRRNGDVAWTREIHSGEQNMSHSVANLEHHQFKYDAHRRPGDVHIHYFGADAFSFGEGFALEAGDVMEVAWDGFGRPLWNTLAIDTSPPSLVSVRPI